MMKDYILFYYQLLTDREKKKDKACFSHYKEKGTHSMVLVKLYTDTI